MEGDSNHMIDLRSFIEYEFDKIDSFYDLRSSDSFSQKYTDPSWIQEQILLLFSQWTTGITRTILRQDILNQARTSRSRQHVKPDATHHPVLHGIIHNIDIIKSSDGNQKGVSSAVIHIKQDGYNLIIHSALHGALLPFVGKFIEGGRQIHFANIRFSNDCLIPNQLCVIDLKRTKADIDFIKQSQMIPLKQINEDNYPDSLLLRVKEPTPDGIMMTDITDDIELYLEDERKHLKQLLNYRDVILFYKPWVQRNDSGEAILIFGPNSVIFRVPVEIGSNQSQVSQHVQSSFTQDGLSYRNSLSCRSKCGTVLEIHNDLSYDNRTDTTTWNQFKMVIQTADGEQASITIYNTSEIPYEVLRVVASVKVNHFVWIFGLLEVEHEFKFTTETTIYNTSQLYSIIASNVVIPKTLNVIKKYKTFVARAIITNVLTCEVKNRHKLCNTILNKSYCHTCQCNICSHKEIDEDFLFIFEIDDMTCDPMKAFGNGSKFSFWSIKPNEWKRASENEKARLTSSLIGREYVFVLSLASENEFGFYNEDYSIYRIDQCIRPVGDIEREVNRLIKWHKKLDNQKKQDIF